MRSGKKLLNDSAAVETAMKGVGTKILSDMKAQQQLVPKLEAAIDKLDSSITALQRRLRSRMPGGTISFDAALDETCIRLRDEYFDALSDRGKLEDALQICQESIAEAQTLVTRGLPRDDSVLGPNG